MRLGINLPGQTLVRLWLVHRRGEFLTRSIRSAVAVTVTPAFESSAAGAASGAGRLPSSWNDCIYRVQIINEINNVKSQNTSTDPYAVRRGRHTAGRRRRTRALAWNMLATRISNTHIIHSFLTQRGRGRYSFWIHTLSPPPDFELSDFDPKG